MKEIDNYIKQHTTKYEPPKDITQLLNELKLHHMKMITLVNQSEIRRFTTTVNIIKKKYSHVQVLSMFKNDITIEMTISEEDMYKVFNELN